MTARIAIVGAGAAGLACASALRRQGLRPVVFEKSRSFGGRIATRRRDGLQFDHGAQALTCAGDPLLAQARASGDVTRWDAATEADGAAPWIGSPRMKDGLASLLPGLDIHYATEIKSVLHRGGAWEIATGAERQTFDLVALAAASEQSLRLLDPSETELRGALEQVIFEPCHALMVAFERPPAWPEVQPAPPDPFTWIAHEGSKPGRSQEPAAFVAHTTAAWSAAHLDTPSEEVARALLAALGVALGPLPPVLLAMGHRWRLARATRPLGRPCAASRDGTLLAGGDWALGRTVADALVSGRAMAEALHQRTLAQVDNG
ncbi:MAG: FAD-dependent oxidoreductase [Pseudomonadota bacterium]